MSRRSTSSRRSFHHVHCSSRWILSLLLLLLISYHQDGIVQGLTFGRGGRRAAPIKSNDNSSSSDNSSSNNKNEKNIHDDDDDDQAATAATTTTSRRRTTSLHHILYENTRGKTASRSTNTNSSSKKKKKHTKNRINRRFLEDAAAGDDASAATDDGSDADERCSEFLISFLEGTTDAHDTCEGIMNAYTAAECASSTSTYSDNHDFDDYFNEFAEHECCQALIAHHSDYCEEDLLLSNLHLFVAATVLLLCECAKALVHRFNIHFLPEAATCILVGTLAGLCTRFLPFGDIDDISFDDDLFLAVLLPPIIFEAALSVSKSELKRRRGAIFMFSVFGTIMSTFLTGFMVHYASMAFSSTTFPLLDSLTFGALISSIDPVAILSVLTSLRLDQKDTIFILVFGESLLNDGIAITVFQTLVDRFDGKTNDGTTSIDEVLEAAASFLIAMFGSIFVGLACGCGAWVFFDFLGESLPPVMQVGSFFLWALIPYYICDGVGWSGIVSIVAVGFFMDVYIAGSKDTDPNREEMSDSRVEDSSYLNMVDDENDQHRVVTPMPSFETARSVQPLPRTERIHLSRTANRHIRFVAHLTSQLAENAIFAYLGLFLFSKNYDWDPTLVSIAICSCVMSRSMMVVIVSYVIFHIYKCRGRAPSTQPFHDESKSSKTATAIRNPRTQAVLVIAGLRGAVSLALVENVPIYNNVTGEGCEFKQLMKGMTSASIIFTTFVFGGGAYYILPLLGITPDTANSEDSVVELHAVDRVQRLEML